VQYWLKQVEKQTSLKNAVPHLKQVKLDTKFGRIYRQGSLGNPSL